MRVDSVGRRDLGCWRTLPCLASVCDLCSLALECSTRLESLQRVFAASLREDPITIYIDLPEPSYSRTSRDGNGMARSSPRCLASPHAACQQPNLRERPLSFPHELLTQSSEPRAMHSYALAKFPFPCFVTSEPTRAAVGRAVCQLGELASPCPAVRPSLVPSTPTIPLNRLLTTSGLFSSRAPSSLRRIRPGPTLPSLARSLSVSVVL